MSTHDDAPKPLPTLDEETDIRPPPPPKPSDVDTMMDPMALPGLGMDLSAQLAANAEETEVETMVANADEAAQMREQARTRALPAPPHPSGDLALKTKDQVAAEEEAAVQALLKGEDPKPAPPAARSDAPLAVPVNDGLRALLFVQGAWNIISGFVWAATIFGIPLGIGCWILAFFEIRLALQAKEIDGYAFAERAKNVSYWEIAAYVWALGVVTGSLGLVIQIWSRKILSEKPA